MTTLHPTLGPDAAGTRATKPPVRPAVPKPPSRLRRSTTARAALALVASMQWMAAVLPAPVAAATPAPSPAAASRAAAAPVVAAGQVTDVAPAANRVPSTAPAAASTPKRVPAPAVVPGATPMPNLPVAMPTAPAASDAVVELDLHVGESRVLPAPGVARIAVGNGNVLTASALDKREVIVFANAPGASTLFIWNEQGQMQRLKLNVTANDVARLAREVGAFLASVKGVKVSSIGDKVIVEGDELADAELARIEQLAQRYPQIVNFTNRQGWEQMVMLDVKVVEFPVNELRELGLRWNAAGGASIGGVWSPFNRIRGGAQQIRIDGEPLITSPGLGQGGTLPLTPNILSALNLGLGATLQAMAQSGRTTLLAEPQLSARNGAKASFLAGGEIPYWVSTVNGPTVLYKPYGVKLDVLPRVDRQGNVRATIETEFSQVDEATAVNGAKGLLVRRTSTEFNVKAGETIVLSGLLQREQANTVDKLPGLGDVPVLGALFRSKRFQNKETELVVFVTPTVVDPRTPKLVDRVEQTNQRLSERLGPSPHLSEPLQPGPKAPEKSAKPTSEDTVALTREEQQ
jgi:pilus assembly protein CpaC